MAKSRKQAASKRPRKQGVGQRAQGDRESVEETPVPAAVPTLEVVPIVEETLEPPVHGFPIVGIGASAGGLAAFEAFFSHMPDNTEPGIAFVLVQHLDPDHKSILSELIRRYTRMQVFEITNGIAVQPNCTYIIPPNKDLALLNGALHLLEPSMPRGRRLPIDFFLRSLAQDCGEEGVCIVLSGNGTDGTLGLRAVKENGGMAMVQDPASAEYDGMPKSAISTGLVDYVLAPAAMPERLVAFAKHTSSHARGVSMLPAAAAGSWMDKIMVLLRGQTKHDFSHYKQKTIHRRVERRMVVNQSASMEEYVQVLRKDTREIQILFRELLIGVTSFFRDMEAFDILQARVLQSLLEERTAGAPVRAWVAGCSTGEEAYSLAIMLQEESERLRKDFIIQIFATDIDSLALEKARAGLYTASITADVSPGRLSRYFVPEHEDFYRVRKSTRDLIIFAEQDILRDPPFSKVDLVSCRNLLIYLEPVLQRKVLPLFHYALNPRGFLFLGSSESIGESTNLFTTFDRRWKIYQRNEAAVLNRFPADFASPDSISARPPGRAEPKEKSLSIREVMERTLLRDYAPTCAAVNGRGEILFVHGRTGKYLEIPPGETTVNIIRSAREGLKLELSSALRKVASLPAPVRHDGLTVRTNGSFEKVNLVVCPMDAAGESSGVVLVIFEDRHEELPVPQPGSPAQSGGEASEDQQVAALERELRLKEEVLQATVEELETSNEELKSTNEELQSTNEEFQSANEELETSKEEMQSINEELVTVNAELQQKIESLSRSNNDMNNLLAGTGIGTLFIDPQLRIVRFTPALKAIINLVPSDVGRLVGDFAANLSGSDKIAADVKAVLDTLVPREAQVQTRDGVWYLMRILPYRTVDNVIEGAVITFVDVTELRRLQDSLRRSEQWLQMALGVSGIRGWTYDLASGRVGHPLPGSADGTDFPSFEAFSSAIHPDDRARVRTTMEEAISAGTEFHAEFRVVETGGERWLLSRGTVWRDAQGRPTALVGIDVDITESKLGGR